MLQATLEDAWHRNDELLNQSVDEHRSNNLRDHREGVNQHLGNACQRTDRGERYSTDDMQRVLDRTREHTKGVTQAQHDEAQESHRAIKPVQPVHTGRTHKVHRPVVFTRGLRDSVTRRVYGQCVLIKRGVQVVVHC